MQHKKPLPTKFHECPECGNFFNHEEELKTHISQDHDINSTDCVQCDFKGDSVLDFVNHIIAKHHNSQEVIFCPRCNFKALGMQSMNDHIETDHIEIALLRHVTANQAAATQNLETFKMELTNILKTLIQEHNVVKQELFILRQNKQEVDEKVSSIKQTVMNIENLVSSAKEPSNRPEHSARTAHNAHPSTSSFSSAPSHGSSTLPKTTSVGTQTKSSPPIANKQTFTKTTQNIPATKPSVPSPPNHNNPKPKDTTSSFNPPQKILFVGDSISGHANINIIADATRSKIVTAKAYSAVFDDVANKAKEAAFFPQKNFLQVVPKEVTKDNFDHLIIQAGSVDITNLNTAENANEYLEYFKQETVLSAKNIFNSVVIALENQTSLKTAIIMKQTPRYDPHNVDPLSLKSALSHLFNNTMMELWMNSPLKDKIYVGSHNIDCSGAIQSARYRHTKSGRFDGVHLYGSSGSKAYTMSVLNILRSASLISSDHDYHLSCDQYKYQNRNQGN